MIKLSVVCEMSHVQLTGFYVTKTFALSAWNVLPLIVNSRNRKTFPVNFSLLFTVSTRNMTESNCKAIVSIQLKNALKLMTTWQNSHKLKSQVQVTPVASP